MNIVIRTDSSIEIGTGHVMRCLTLAKQLQRHGARITFVCRNLKGNSINYLQSEGFEVLTISSTGLEINNSDLIEENWSYDVKETILLTKEIKIDFVIVDHYSLDIRWEETIRSVTEKILVIDELANRLHDCDILLDQNFYKDIEGRYKGLVPENCILMLGPEYVLLRDEFIEAARELKNRTGKVNNLLIFFGGTDPTGETVKTLNAVKEMDYYYNSIDVVVGSANPDKDKINEICNEIENAHFHCQISNMAELMLKADLAIGAGGSTTWERCILALPSIVIDIAENQKAITKSLADLNQCISLGSFENIKTSDIKNILNHVLHKPQKLKNISVACSEIINYEQVEKYSLASLISEVDR